MKIEYNNSKAAQSNHDFKTFHVHSKPKNNQEQKKKLNGVL